MSFLLELPVPGYQGSRVPRDPGPIGIPVISRGLREFQVSIVLNFARAGVELGWVNPLVDANY